MKALVWKDFVSNKYEKEKLVWKEFIDDKYTKKDIKYAVLEVSPSKFTSNLRTRWLITEFSQIYKPIMKRLKITDKRESIHQN